MSDIAIKVDNLSKRYRIGAAETQHDTFLSAVGSWLKSPASNFKQLRKLSSFNENGEMEDVIWALKDVSFEVKRGEVIGLIGRNGAGKSTLLKILSRITPPTTGRIELNGRVASLLEVGTGFHPELTGRENIYLNGTILGMTKTEVDSKFDEIVDFSGVEKFIDTPVKRYSSGMRVRLAFSVAAHLEPEILLVDEVLAVGDAAFQKKCLGKMDEVSSTGRTVFFVSHNMGMIHSLCPRTILLQEGKINLDGKTSDAITRYLSSGVEKSLHGTIAWEDVEAPGGDEMKLRRIRLLDSDGNEHDSFNPSQDIEIEITYVVHSLVRGIRWVVQLKTQEGIIAFTTTDHLHRGEKSLTPGTYQVSCFLPGYLLNKGRYHVVVHAGIPGVNVLVAGQEWISFVIEGINTHGSYHNDQSWPGVLAPKIEWSSDTIIIEYDEKIR